MRSLPLALLLATTLAAPVLAAPAPPDAGRLATAMSAQPLRRLGGGSLAWRSLRGEVVVLHFWASWCAPCRKELPQIQALHLELAKSGGRVVAVSIDADRRNAADFAARHAPSLPIYHDPPDGLARTLDLPALPYTVVLDRDGSVLWAGGGADTKTRVHYAALAQRAAVAGTPAAESTEGPSR
jgi:thiol-disulfide isomerase/thioredoxin